MTGPALVADLTGTATVPGANLAGFDEVLLTPGPLAAAPARLPVSALVPNMAEYVRDAADNGIVGAATARLRRAGPATLARLVGIGATSARRIMRREMGALMSVLLELELGRVRRVLPARVVLAAGVTDLALAARNVEFFSTYARFVRRFHRAEPWLETRNPGHLLAALQGTGAPVAGVILPLNRAGFGMKPTLESSLDELAKASVRIWARDVTAGGAIPLDEAIAYAVAHGASGVVLAPEEGAAAGAEHAGALAATQGGRDDSIGQPARVPADGGCSGRGVHD